MTDRKNRPPLCPCKDTCAPIWNGMAFDERVKTGDLNEGYSGDCIGQSDPLIYIVGGESHLNDMNHCIFTPLKGIIRFQINKEDVEGILQMSRAVLAEIEPQNCAVCGAGRRTAHFIVKEDGKRICCLCDRERT